MSIDAKFLVDNAWFFCCCFPVLMLVLLNAFVKALRRPKIDEVKPGPIDFTKVGNSSDRDPEWEREQSRRVQEEEDFAKGTHELKLEREERERAAREAEEQANWEDRQQRQREEDE